MEFDRVHYPLPLTFQESPAPSDLKATLRRLQDELAQAKRDAQASAELEVRCQTLTATIAAQAKEIDQLRKQVLQGGRRTKKRKKAKLIIRKERKNKARGSYTHYCKGLTAAATDSRPTTTNPRTTTITWLTTTQT